MHTDKSVDATHPERLGGGLREELLGGDDTRVRVEVEELRRLAGSLSLRLLPEHHRVLKHKPPLETREHRDPNTQTRFGNA